MGIFIAYGTLLEKEQSSFAKASEEHKKTPFAFAKGAKSSKALAYEGPGPSQL
jgi:hypothetical protein